MAVEDRPCACQTPHVDRFAYVEEVLRVRHYYPRSATSSSGPPGRYPRAPDPDDLDFRIGSFAVPAPQSPDESVGSRCVPLHTATARFEWVEVTRRATT